MVFVLLFFSTRLLAIFSQIEITFLLRKFNKKKTLLEMDEDVVFIDDENSMQSWQAASDPKTETRPLMLLFERLISNDTKSNTVLTNAQIISILEKEYNMDVSAMHELEIEIYISIVKKFLKDWPQWDAFDRVITRLRKRDSQTVIKSILEEKYKHLKQYLQEMIKSTAADAKKAVDKVKEGGLKTTESETSNTLLEIYCTRKQLNKFIFNKPQGNSIFNVAPFEMYKENLTIPHFTFASLLNWFGVRLTIELKNIVYTRLTMHRLNHTLVNKKNGPRYIKKELDQSIQMKPLRNATVDEFPIPNILLILDKILQYYADKIEFNMVQDIFNVIRSDLNISSRSIEVPGMYKTYSSKYPYVRKLYADVPTASTNHDFYIEEVVTPIQDWNIGKMVKVSPQVPSLQTWLKFECAECKQKFNGAEFLTLLRDHFRVYHNDEPNWTCTNCDKEFTMAEITNMGWRHAC